MKIDNKKQSKSTPKPMMGGPRAGMGLAEKPKDFWNTMKKLSGYLKQYRVSIILVLIFAIASTVFAILSPKILGNMTNQVVSDYIDIKTYNSISSNIPEGMQIPDGTTAVQLIEKMPDSAKLDFPADKIDKIADLDISKKPTINFEKLGSFAITLLVLYLLSAAFSFIQGWIMTSVSQKVSYNLRRDISEKINRLPLSYFDRKSFGDVLSRTTNDVDTISQTLNQSLSQMVTSISMIIGILIMMLTISWQMTLVSVITLPLGFLLISTIIKKSQKYFKEQQDQLGEINSHVEEMYAGHNIMRVYRGEKRSVAKFKNINNKLFGSAWRSQFFSGLMMPLMTFVGNLSFVGVTVVGGLLAIKGHIQIGDIQAFIQYVNQFNRPIVQTANVANILQSTAAASERVFEFLEEKEEIVDVKNPAIIKNFRGEVKFENVSFGYNESKEVIHSLSTTTKPGQRVAIVGPTGAGKTTIVNLLMRFYEINKGSIKIDGVNIKDIKRTDVRNLFGMVLQDTWLFNGTIRENISYANPEATDQDIANASKAAHVDHFIHALPDGYAIMLTEEADNISQGERQLLTIARAMLAKSPMLILDEATSSVDTRTELLIQKAMENLMKNKTSFVIAHRLSTIRDADLILVMNEGNVVEQGTHKSLVAQNGLYASLYNSQFVSGNAK